MDLDIPINTKDSRTNLIAKFTKESHLRLFYIIKK